MLLLKILSVLWLITAVANIITILVAAKKADTYHTEYPIDCSYNTEYNANQSIEDK